MVKLSWHFSNGKTLGFSTFFFPFFLCQLQPEILWAMSLWQCKEHDFTTWIVASLKAGSFQSAPNCCRSEGKSLSSFSPFDKGCNRNWMTGRNVHCIFCVFSAMSGRKLSFDAISKVLIDECFTEDWIFGTDSQRDWHLLAAECVKTKFPSGHLWHCTMILDTFGLLHQQWCCGAEDKKRGGWWVTLHFCMTTPNTG